MTKRILNSSNAVLVLHQLSQQKEGDYTKSIAEELDIPFKSVNITLRNLYDQGLVEQGKRTKAQYYRIDPEGIADYWIKQIKDNYEQINYKGINDEGEKEIKRRYNYFKDNEDQIRNFLEEFIPLVLQSYTPNTETTLSDILFESAAKTILEIQSSPSTEVLDEKDHLKIIPLAVRDFKGTYAYVLEAKHILNPELNYTGYVDHNDETEHE